MKKYCMTVSSGFYEEAREGTALYFYQLADDDCVAQFDCHLEEYLEKEEACDVHCDKSLLDIAVEYFSIMFNFPEIAVEEV